MGPEPTKRCAACGEIRPREEFAKGKRGWRSRCAPCHSKAVQDYLRRKKEDPETLAKNAAATRAWAEKKHLRDPEWVAANLRAKRNQHFKSTYGITLDQYETLLDQQGGHCAVCPSTDHLQLDHDHKTHAVRGILCQNCNHIVTEHATPDRLRAAALYLESERPNLCKAIET